MRILSIGDIHGLDLWKDLTHGSTYDFSTWKIAVDNGANAADDIWKDMPFMSFGKIIFIGDYVDSFTITGEVIKQNLLDIIFFKKALPDKVVLILGNHDVQYIVPNQICSGFRGEMAIDLKQIFLENYDCFKMCHFEKSRGVKWLWTHGGVSNGWMKEARASLKRPDRWHHENMAHYSKEIDDIINWLWLCNSEVMFQADRHSQGPYEWASPLWARNVDDFKLVGHGDTYLSYNQVVGHTPKEDIVKYEWREGKKNFAHYHIDCLPKTHSGLILNI